MKNKLLLCGLALLSTQAFATNQGPGCGIGTNIFKGQSGLIAHTSAGTTNGTFSQITAIGLGTSGCTSESTVSNDLERQIFAANNFDELAKESAQGQGDYLMSLAMLMQIETNDQSEFYQLLQHNHNALFKSDANNLLSSLDNTLASNITFAKYIK
jgi:hypothetical protein